MTTGVYKMNEIEKVKYAKSFIDDLANGINPLDGTPTREDDIVNNVRLSRCFFFVSDVLRRVCESSDGEKIILGHAPKRGRRVKQLFSITAEQISRFEPSETPISATVLAKKINALVDTANMKKLSYADINRWLICAGFLELRDVGGGKLKKHPTPEGEAIGIELQYWRTRGRVIPVVFYSAQAQKFIVDNIEGVIATAQDGGKYSDQTDEDKAED